MRPPFAGTACLPLLLAAVERPPTPPAPPRAPPPLAAADPCPQCVRLAIPSTTSATTAGAPRAEVSRWPCAPAIAEDGPEVWYSFRLDAPRRVRASIVEDPGDGIDVDVHLLASADPDGCFARDDEGVDALLPAGTWFLVVDTCASTGQPLPGRFELTLREVGPPQ